MVTTPPEDEVDVIFREVLEAGERPDRLLAVLEPHDPDDATLRMLLHRAVPLALLELLGSRRPWCVRPQVLGGVVLAPRCPRALALRLVGGLFWHDLAEVAAANRLPSAVRLRAESQLTELLPDLRPGDRIALARLATPAVLARLLSDADARVLDAALWNPRLSEADLTAALRQADVPVALVEEVASSPRWRDNYRVRLEIALQPRSPLALALAQLTSLLRRDLRRVAGAQGLRPVICLAAARLLDQSPQTPPAQ